MVSWAGVLQLHRVLRLSAADTDQAVEQPRQLFRMRDRDGEHCPTAVAVQNTDGVQQPGLSAAVRLCVCLMVVCACCAAGK
jgi:hypothetical protein